MVFGTGLVERKLEMRRKLYWLWALASLLCPHFILHVRDKRWFLSFEILWFWNTGSPANSKSLMGTEVRSHVFLLDMSSGFWEKRNLKPWWRKLTQATGVKTPNKILTWKWKKIILCVMDWIWNDPNRRLCWMLGPQLVALLWEVVPSWRR
jgi:hypothetical protein